MSESSRTDQPLIKRLTDIVLANISKENFGVEDLAREAGLSRITIYRKIKSVKNQDPTQFIKEIRLRKAMELLKQNENTVSEIAFRVGFGSTAYFCKCFHDYFGFSPGKVKREAIKDIEETTPVEIIETIERKKPFRRPFIIHALVLITFIVLICIVYFLFVRKSNSGKAGNAAGSMKSIAVLPFRNLTDSTTNQYFIDGVAEDILANLSKMHELRVLSWTSTLQFRGSKKSPSEIAGILDIRYLVEGSGQKLGNNLVLRVGLIDALNEKKLWAGSYSRQILNTTDLVLLQTEIAQSIAYELKTVISPEEKQLIEKESTPSLTALDFYQRAREELGTFQFHDLIVNSTTYPIFFDNPLKRNVVEKARLLYKTALRFDSTFAPAYADLAAINWSENYFREYFSTHYLDSVLILANKALSFDSRLPDAYFMRAMYYSETGNTEKARLDFSKALELDPNHWLSYYCLGTLYLEEYPDADYTIAIDNFLKAASRYHGSALPYLLERIGYVLNITGFSDLAFNYNLKASQLELDSSKYFLSLASLTVWGGGGDTLKARHFIDEAYKRDSNNVNILRSMIFNYYEKGDYNNSLRIYRKYRGLLKEQGITMVNELHRFAPIYSALGMNDSAEYLYNKQLEYCNAAIKLGRPYGKSFAYYDLAIIYASKGDIKKALENLNIFKKRKGMCMWFGISGSEAGNFGNDPELQKINKEIYSKYLKEHERVKKWLEESE